MAEERSGGFWRRFGTLFGVGAIGVVALVPVIAPTIRRQLESLPAEPGLPFTAVVALSLVNPLVLLAIGVAVGIRLAPRIGLLSLLDQRASEGTDVWPRLKPDLGLALGLGVGGGAALLILDLLFQPYLQASLQGLEQPEGNLVLNLIGGVLYGGITEELMVRWGLMTFLAWVAWRVVGRGQLAPGPSIMWGAIVGSAVAFGVGHLPAVAAAAPLTGLMVTRTILLNALGGVLFGWLFWRRSLEAAMVAHASFHIVFAAANLVGG